MPIDWLKAEQFPDKLHKVDGQYLLDLRNKVNDLENELTIKEDKVRKLLIQLTAKDEEIVRLTELGEQFKEKSDELKREKIEFLTEIAQHLKKKEQLEGKLTEAEKKLINKVRGFESAQKQWNENFTKQNEEIEKSKSQYDIINELENKIKDTEKYLQLKIQAVNNLHDQIKELEATPAVLARIKNIMGVKGFLNEKEFENLLSEK